MCRAQPHLHKEGGAPPGSAKCDDIKVCSPGARAIEFMFQLFFWLATAAAGLGWGTAMRIPLPGGCRRSVISAGEDGRRTGGAREETCAGGVGDSDRSPTRLGAAGEFFHRLESGDVLEMVPWCRNSEKLASGADSIIDGMDVCRDSPDGGRGGADPESVSSGLLSLLSQESVSLEMPIQDDLL